MNSEIVKNRGKLNNVLNLNMKLYYYYCFVILPKFPVILITIRLIILTTCVIFNTDLTSFSEYYTLEMNSTNNSSDTGGGSPSGGSSEGGSPSGENPDNGGPTPGGPVPDSPIPKGPSSEDSRSEDSTPDGPAPEDPTPGASKRMISELSDSEADDSKPNKQPRDNVHHSVTERFAKLRRETAETEQNYQNIKREVKGEANKYTPWTIGMQDSESQTLHDILCRQDKASQEKVFKLNLEEIRKNNLNNFERKEIHADVHKEGTEQLFTKFDCINCKKK